MATHRARLAIAVLVTSLTVPLLVAQASPPPDYKLGDVAAEDIVTPVALLVVNPEATDALKQKIAQQVQFVVRHTPQSVGETETALRDTVAAARKQFFGAFQQALDGRPPAEADLASDAFTRTIADVARTSPRDLPFDKLAPLWVRGQSDERFVDSLVQPVRAVMAQIIVASKTDSPLPINQTVRLVAVKSLSEAPTVAELERPGTTIPVSKMTSLWRARRLVETSFPTDQEALGRFAASFIRSNAVPDPAMTEILRAKRIEGVTANDTYDAAQTVVRKGQTIDRKALSALAAMREKSLIGTLQTKLQQEQSKSQSDQSIAGEIKQQTTWIAAGLGAVCLALLVILWRIRAVRPAPSLSPVLVGDPALPDAADPRGLPAGAADDSWRGRAIAAEGKAERAHAAIKSGVLAWMREKIVSTLFRQRAELLSVQQRAEAEMRELEQRLEQLHTPLQQRILAYEKRIEELEADLAAKGEENRQLLGARLHVARQHLQTERERFGTN